jgi:hypothetical protein
LGADGCTFSDAIAEAADDAINHGGFVKRVTQLMNDAKKAGLITGRQKGAVVSCAAGTGSSPGHGPARQDRDRAGRSR